MKRDWSEARAKVEAEGCCRVCGDPGDAMAVLEAAHIIGRDRDFYCPLGYEEGAAVRIVAATKLEVHPDRIVPLCRHMQGGCHPEYDAHKLDLLPHLTLDEQLQAVADAGGLELARVRLCPSAYRESTEKGRAA